MNTKAHISATRSATKIAAIYIVVASLWIFLSDTIVLQFLHDPNMLTEIQTIKGWFFVIVSGLLIYRLVRDEASKYIRTRDRLRESERRYRMLIDQFPAAAILLYDKDLNYTFADGALWSKIGIKPGDMTGKPTDVNIPPEYTEQLRQNYQQAFQGTANTMEIMLNDSWLVVNTAPLIDDNGEVIAGIAVMHDITENKAMMTALRLSESRYRELFESISNMLLVCAPERDGREFRIVEVNKAAMEMTGLERNGLEGHTLNEALPEFPVGTLNETMRDVLESGLQYTYIEPLVKPDGTMVWINLTLFRYHQRHVVIICADVTEHMESMNALRESEEKFRIISEQSLMAIIIIQNDIIKYANQAVATISGYPLNEMLNWAPGEWTELIHPDDREFVILHAKHNKFDELTVTTHFTYRCVRKSGEIRWLEQYSQHIQYQGHPAVLSTIIDITDQKTIEDEFIQSQKMETIGKLASSIIHDFNNLITIISGNTDLLLEKDLDDEKHELVEEIGDAAERSMKLTRQLLTFSRRQVVKPYAINLNDVIHNDEHLIRRLLGKRIDLDMHLSSPLNTIYVDPGHMEQILTNLAVNARYAMENGGTLTIETDNRQINSENTTEFESVSPGDYVLVRISDTGCGMDEHTKEHAFEPFFTTRDEENGTGLGLSTCYSIVKRYNGYIFIDSAPGEGTTFSILIPSLIDNIQKELSITESEYRGNETILVVDDDKPSRRMIEQILNENGYNVLSTDNGEDALRILNTAQTEPSLIICSMDMPRMEAKLLKQRICKSYKHLIVTGYTNIPAPEISGDSESLLFKPFTKTELLGRIRRLLDMPRT